LRISGAFLLGDKLCDAESSAKVPAIHDFWGRLVIFCVYLFIAGPAFTLAMIIGLVYAEPVIGLAVAMSIT
jgi:hypothetical protein